mmetsp:Transcript_25792/g.38617  ORF Transcript_25792/g.38617 Transcript_25792/m.38617 type:complete len:126 (-) Transcript_25792:158-535(-)|eukprot:CAMPEP_0203730182 /NCGR_PEP_ID=MMETSP0092-20131115/19080_1 /ASSEMBLY_ACC=CAM_ASM_001090 /TAXON_ID=426623 /ORGANISM="Chaetoceros affinis, Strain CCMP159" /LENGTH=125 /DNA_ID=CAMNT_0050612909 /DNA_START=133 /DNA_END=510 /DNA_ORIENTATION=+
MNHLTTLFARRISSSLAKSDAARFTQQTFPTFSRAWLSDPSVYPLIAIMSFTLSMCAGAGIHALTQYEDVRLSPIRRHAIFRTWGDDHDRSLVRRITRRPEQQEGLGVDHKAWKAAKDEYKKNPL